jgi:hypothetical protein
LQNILAVFPKSCSTMRQTRGKDRAGQRAHGQNSTNAVRSFTSLHVS